MKTARTKSKVYVFKENTQTEPIIKPIIHLQEFGQPSCWVCGCRKFTTALIHETDQFSFDHAKAKLIYHCANIGCGHGYNIRKDIPTESGLKVGDQIIVKSR